MVIERKEFGFENDLIRNDSVSMLMTFLQPQPEGSKIFIFIKKNIPSPVEKLSLVRLEISTNYPSLCWKYQKIIPSMCWNCQKFIPWMC
jgi:hypothetical protein